MEKHLASDCPECVENANYQLGRREFIRVAGAGLAVGAGATWSNIGRAEPAKKEPKPAEGLIRELVSTLSEEQKRELILPFDHGAGMRNQPPTRLRTFNSAVLNKRIGQNYTPAQQELVRTIFKSILSSEEAYERITRHGRWDGSGSFEGNGAVLFGDPEGKFTWVFAGHHLTVRCDGNSEPGAAFGGPMYYGHSAHGYSDQNVYNYQTKQVMAVYDALDEKQRANAVVVGNPGDRDAGIRFRADGQPHPGVAYANLDASQQKLIAGVMRTLLEPFRKEDGDEVMELIRANGGMEKIHLAFFKDDANDPDQRWSYWRLEGPGFIWNYRVLPHVHCYVNIVEKA